MAMEAMEVSKILEEAFYKETASRYDAILAAIPDIIAEMDAKRTYAWMNRAGLNFFGEDAIGKDASHYFVDWQEFNAVFEQLLESDDDVLYFESLQRRKDGATRVLAWWSRALKDDEGKITSVLSTARDITARETTERLQKVLLDIANSINACESLDELYPTIQCNLSQILDTSNFFIALYDKEYHTLSFPYFFDEQDEYDVVPAEKTNCHYIIRTGKALLADRETFANLNAQGEIITRGELSSPLVWLGAPLKRGKEVFGVVAVQSYTDSHAYDENDKEILQLVSHQIAVVIQRKLAEKRVKHLNSLLLAIRNINQEIVHSTDIKELFQRTAEILLETRGYMDVHLAYVDDKKGTIYPIAHCGAHEQRYWESDIKEVSGLPECIKTVLDNCCKEIIISTVDKCNDCQYCSHDYDHQSIIVPLFDRTHVIGVISICCEREKKIYDDELGLIDEIASDLSYAIDNLKTDKKLKISKKRFEDVTNNAAEWIWEIDTEGKYTYSSPAVEQIYGYSVEEILDMHFYDLCFSEEQDDFKKIAFEEIINKQRAFKDVMNKCIDKHGNHVWVTSSGIPFYDDGGRLLGYRGSDIGITHIKNTEEALRESEERFRTIYEKSIVGFYRTTPDGKLLMANDTLVKLLGYSSFKELAGINLERGAYEPKYSRNNFKKLMEEKGEVIGLESTWTKKDDEMLHVRENATAAFDEQGNILYYDGVVEDITKRKQIEDMMKKEFERAEFYNDLMCHDISNFNQGILSNLELLLLTPDEPDKCVKYAENAFNHAMGSINLISNLRKLRKLHEGGGNLRNVDVLPIFQEAVDNAKRRFPNKTLKLNSNLTDRQYLAVGDMLMFDVFVNILTNAMKFDRNEVVEIDVEIVETEDFWMLGFKDNGPGMDDKLKSQIFDRSYMDADKHSHSGLGLTLVRTILKSYGGEIWVEDGVSGDRTKGSNFVLMIPKVT